MTLYLRIALVSLCILAGFMGAPMETPGFSYGQRTDAPATTY